MSIVLSSYGLCHLYNYLKAEGAKPVMAIDIDASHVELAIISQRKLLFSRYFKLLQPQADWVDLFAQEISRTNDAYLKEVALASPGEFVLFGERKGIPEFYAAIKGKINLPLEVLSYADKIGLAQGPLLNKIFNSENSFVSLAGLALEDIPDSLNLLPVKLKEESHRLLHTKEFIRTILFICGIILVSGLGIARSLENKAGYLKQLKTELRKIETEAKPLEGLNRRFQLLEKSLRRKTSALDIIYELHQVIPQEVSLVNLTYEEGEGVTLYGQTQELNSVFRLASVLEKSAVFQDFDIKVKYATKKNTLRGELVDFEIVCSKEK